MAASYKKPIDLLPQLEADLKRLRKSDVLVGIQAKDTMREGQAINNASLLFIHTHGSPLRHIPARPVLEPAIKANRDIIVPPLEAAARRMLAHDPAGAERALERAGRVATSAAKRWFTDPRNHWRPLAASTIRARLRRLKGKTKKQTIAAIEAGENPFTPLVDIGRMRGAINWVLRLVR